MQLISRRSAHAGNPIEDADRLANKLASSGMKITKLNQGNPTAIFPTPKYIIDAYIDALRAGKTGYSFHAGIPELRDAIAKRQGRMYGAKFEREDVIVTQGVSESINFFNSLFIDNGDRAVLFRPYYPTYYTFLKTTGGEPIFADFSGEGEHKFDPDALRKAIERNGKKRIKFLIFSNPCNPTGMVMQKKELKELVEITKDNDIFLISDEIYDEIVYNGAEFTSISQVAEGTKYALMGGASKDFDATGFRLGYAIIPGKDKDSMAVNDKFCDYAKMRLSSNTTAQYAFTEALENRSAHKRAITQMVSQIAKRANRAYSVINESSHMKVARTSGAFYLLPEIDMEKLRFKNDAEIVERLLIEEGIEVSRGSGFGAPGHIRIVALAPEDILEGAIRKIDKFFVKHSK